MKAAISTAVHLQSFHLHLNAIRSLNLSERTCTYMYQGA